MSKKITLFSILFTSVLLITIYILLVDMYNEHQENVRSVSLNVTHDSLHTLSEVTFNEKKYEKTITLSAIGDVLIHNTVYHDAKETDGYNFKKMLAPIKEELSNSDITIANQESIAGGIELGLSSYPRFNSPFEVTDALKEAGVDVYIMANNHTLDRGERAILNAISYYDKNELLYVGAHKNSDDKELIRVMDIAPLKIAYLAYTYGTNGIPIPTGKDYLVNLLEEEKIVADIQAARELADFIILNLHWGNEYHRFPTDDQKRLAQVFANAGADLIIGHHPHVLQPMEWLERENGQRSFVIYSLGNFLSGQMWDYKDIGGIFKINIKVTVSGEDNVKIMMEQPHLMPTYVASRSFRQYEVVPLIDAEPYGLKNASSIYEEIQVHMNQWLED